MKTLYFLFILIITSGCKSPLTDKTVIATERNRLNNDTSKEIKDTFRIDTLTINNQHFIQTSKNGNFNSLRNINGNTIVEAQDYYSEVKFLDINNDGFKDIRIFGFTNTPNECDNYFFDKGSKTFRHIEDCDLDIQIIKGSNYYYSYNAIGCGDDCWESHLLTIKDWHAITRGHLVGRENDIDEKEIKVYQVNNNKEVLIKSLPITAIKKFKDKKFGFIESYWTNNYKIFAN